MTKTFPIRNKPSKPVRLKNQNHEKRISYLSLEEVIDIAREWGAPFVECDVEIDSGYGYSCDCSVILSWSGPEPIEIFQERVGKYEKALESYDAWYNENKDEIVVEVARRKEVKAEAIKASAQEKVDKLAAELAKNQKRLRAMS